MSYGGPGPQGKCSFSVGVGAGLMTLSAADFFQMLKMELRLDSTAHHCLLLSKRKRRLPGRSCLQVLLGTSTAERPNCALADDRVREGTGKQEAEKHYLSGKSLCPAVVWGIENMGISWHIPYQGCARKWGARLRVRATHHAEGRCNQAKASQK